MIKSTKKHWAPMALAGLLVAGAPVIAQAAHDCTTLTGNGIQSCSFETATTAGWTLKDMASPFCAAGAYTGGAGDCWGFFPAAATQGSDYFATGFDGSGPDTIELSQDMYVAAPGLLKFHYQAAWDMFNFGGSTLPRLFVVDIEPLGGGAPVQTIPVLTALPGTTNPNTGVVEVSADLSAYIGLGQRVKFRWVVPESFTGPAEFVLDNIELVGVAAAICPALPGACSAPTKGSVSFKNNTDATKRKMQWKWNGGTAMLSDFGDPVAGSTNYRLCLYDDGVLSSQAGIAPGGTCDGKPCWATAGSSGLKFKSKTPNASGVTQLSLKAGTGKAKIGLKGKGSGLDWPLPIADAVAVTVNLVKDAPSGSQCWGLPFPNPAVKNDADNFSDKTP